MAPEFFLGKERGVYQPRKQAATFFGAGSPPWERYGDVMGTLCRGEYDCMLCQGVEIIKQGSDPPGVHLVHDHAGAAVGGVHVHFADPLFDARDAAWRH